MLHVCGFCHKQVTRRVAEPSWCNFPGSLTVLAVLQCCTSVRCPRRQGQGIQCVQSIRNQCHTQRVVLIVTGWGLAKKMALYSTAAAALHGGEYSSVGLTDEAVTYPSRLPPALYQRMVFQKRAQLPGPVKLPDHVNRLSVSTRVVVALCDWTIYTQQDPPGRARAQGQTYICNAMQCMCKPFGTPLGPG